MRRPVIAGNWKMYKTIREAVDFVQTLKTHVVATTHCEIVIAPVFTAIRAVADRLDGSNIRVASQDVAAETGPGAFTGEVSAAMVRDAGAAYAIVGHSERRQYYCETDTTVNQKARSVLAAGLVPIICVGERIDQRGAGKAETTVDEQLLGGLANLTAQEVSNIILAYEPVWAIGTGQTATPEIAEQMHSFIRSRLRKMFGDAQADGIRILYGGSVKPDNIARLMQEPDIDGALVGGASLDPDSFSRIVNYKDSR